MIYSRIGFLLLARSGPPRRTSLNAPTRFGCNPHSGRRHDNRHYRPRFKAPFAGLQQRGDGARTVRKGRSATRYLGHSACPRRPRISMPLPGSASRMRRTGSGRWKRCCAGAPAVTRNGSESRAVAGDVLARQMNGAGASRRDFALLSNDSQGNARSLCARRQRASSRCGRWPVEYNILGCEPAAWEPWHSIAVMRQIGFLMGSVWWKLWRAAALPIVGADEISQSCVSMMAATTAVHAARRRGQARSLAALADLKPGIEALLATARSSMGAEVDGGSNNWASRPQKTATGRPIARRRSAPRAGNAEHVCAGSSRLRRLRRHRAHRPRRARFPAFRP